MKTWIVLIWLAILAATVAGGVFAIFYFWDRISDLPVLWREITPLYWALTLLCISAFYLLDYVRLYTLLGILDARISLYTWFKVTVFAQFASMLTPMGELHLPATVYILMKSGIPGPKATAAGSAKTMYIVTWICIAGLSFLLFSREIHVPARIHAHLPYYCIPLFSIVLLFSILILFASSIHRFTAAVLSRHGMRPWKKKILLWVDKSAGALATIGKSTHSMHLFSHITSILYIMAYCLTGYILCHAVGLETTISKAAAVFSIGLMVAYLVPVPGSAGVTELSTAYLLDPQLGPQSLVVVIIIRILSVYAALLPGALIFMIIVRQEGFRYFFENEKKPESPQVLSSTLETQPAKHVK